jgi:hypothetical protein
MKTITKKTQSLGSAVGGYRKEFGISQEELASITTFYPLATGQPHPGCALRRNRFPGEHASSQESVASATRAPYGHVHFKPSSHLT